MMHPFQLNSFRVPKACSGPLRSTYHPKLSLLLNYIVLMFFFHWISPLPTPPPKPGFTVGWIYIKDQHIVIVMIDH